MSARIDPCGTPTECARAMRGTHDARSRMCVCVGGYMYRKGIGERAASARARGHILIGAG